jgi:hypothetical protein
MAAVSACALALLAQWVTFKLSTPGQNLDVGEWPFLMVGLALAAVPATTAIRLATGRGGHRVARASALVIAFAGALAIMFALGFMSMGIAWALLIGGSVMVVGSIATVVVLRPGGRSRLT